MAEAEVKMILQRSKAKFPEAKPRIIADHLPRFLRKGLGELIRGIPYLETLPLYPQSNGKIECWQQSLK
jgi:uncharacterized protein YdhG (YjbR/CyaY superfamily)